MTEETLSDKIIKGNSWSINSYNAYCDTEDVKKFIKEVKYPKPDMELTIENLHKWIDKLAGEKLR